MDNWFATRWHWENWCQTDISLVALFTSLYFLKYCDCCHSEQTVILYQWLLWRCPPCYFFHFCYIFCRVQVLLSWGKCASIDFYQVVPNLIISISFYIALCQFYQAELLDLSAPCREWYTTVREEEAMAPYITKTDLLIGADSASCVFFFIVSNKCEQGLWGC